ncbi:hypothetical protein Q5P01_008547 [Channa striata]|uniref:Uncharacterized protein n=1 Tax=Channa striata TaxID=64152 RepID=A0AA88N493_CHASR|nr:hypothetical protein Q5P01_008547 [Channa striata]
MGLLLPRGDRRHTYPSELIPVSRLRPQVSVNTLCGCRVLEHVMRLWVGGEQVDRNKNSQPDYVYRLPKEKETHKETASQDGRTDGEETVQHVDHQHYTLDDRHMKTQSGRLMLKPGSSN